MVRAVVDTNVLVSALISKKQDPLISKKQDLLISKKPSYLLEVYNLIRSADFLLITSQSILDELEEVLEREEIVGLHQRTSKQIQEILAEIVETSFIVPGLVSVEAVKADPDDDKFIAAAIEGKADYVISGDKPLLNIKEYQRIKILTPADFLKRLGDK